MIILVHVLIAFAGLVATTFTYLNPSDNKIKTSWVFAFLTLASGVYLVASIPTALVHACVAGIIYLGIMTFGIVAARHKLATVHEKTD